MSFSTPKMGPEELTMGRMRYLMTRIRFQCMWLIRTTPHRVRGMTIWTSFSRTPPETSETSSQSNIRSSTTKSSRI